MRFTLLSILLVLIITILLLLSDKGAQSFRRRFRRRDCKSRAKIKPCKLPRPAVVEAAPLEVIPETRRIVGECFADVNRCPSGACVKSYRTTYHCFWWRGFKMICPNYGVVNSVTVTETVDCGIFGQRNVDRVTSCACGDDTGITLVVKVTDAENGAMLSGVSVTLKSGGPVLRNRLVTEDTVNVGNFRATAEIIDSVALVNANKEGYIPATKRVKLPGGVTGPLTISIVLVKSADPVEINSAEETTLSISDDPTNPAAGVASFTISPNSLKDANGDQYDGPVLACVNYVSASNPAIEQIATVFQTRENFQVSQLLSDGIFAIEFKDPSGNPLTTGPMTISTRGMRIWSVYKGYWDPILPEGEEEPLPVAGRKKRQTEPTNNITALIPTAQWVNLDIIFLEPECFFKARVFQSSGSMMEITSSSTATFLPSVRGLITSSNPPFLLSFPTSATRNPDTTCHRIQCPGPGARFSTLIGSINMTSIETVNLGGAMFLIETTLKPKQLSQYSLSIQSALNSVNFQVAANQIDINALLTSSPTGPFYDDLNTCINSDIDDPALHFWKPEPPSSEPLPEGAELCTARITLVIYAGQFTLEALADSEPLNITAVSTGTIEGTDFVYTDVANLFIPPDASSGQIFSVCLLYLCSTDKFQTTVYIGVSSPTFPGPTFDDFYSEFSDDEQSQIYEDIPPGDAPILNCIGSCTDPLCLSNPDAQFVGFAGSFVAPAGAGSGPDFFSSNTSNGCPLIPADTGEPIAISMTCLQRSNQFPGEGPNDGTV